MEQNDILCQLVSCSFISCQFSNGSSWHSQVQLANTYNQPPNLHILNHLKIRSFLINVYKHLKIIHAQTRMLQFCANTYNIENFFCFILKSHNPQVFPIYKTNIGKCTFWVLHHTNGSLHSSSLTFLVMKQMSCSFTIESAISSSFSMTSYKVVNWELQDAKLPWPLSFDQFGLGSCMHKGAKTRLFYHIPLQYEKPFAC